MESLEPTLGKVSIFVLRTSERGRELLVFDHPSAGTQVPAGTVEVGEDVRAAAQRELWEESGLEAALDELRWLQRTVTTLPAGEFVALAPLALSSDAVDASGAGTSVSISRGMRVRGEHEPSGGFAHVSYRELVDAARADSAVRWSASGYVARSLLGQRIERHYFALELARETPSTWTRVADGHLFSFRFAALSPPPQLTGEQQRWLSALDALIHD